MTGALLLLTLALGPPGYVEDAWALVLSWVLVGPLYYLRRHVNRLFDAAKHQLEQIGLPDSAQTDRSEKTDPASTGAAWSSSSNATARRASEDTGDERIKD
jgi:hypothetical protein